MPLGAARITLLAFSPSVQAEAEVIRKKIGVSAFGNAQVDTAQSKFGGASALFDGSGDYLSVGDVSITQDEDLTIEGWVRFNALPSIYAMFAGGAGNGEYVGLRNFSGTWALNAAYNDSGVGTYYYNYELGSTPTTGVWYHWAVVKSGSTIKHFWNGTELTTDYNSTGTMTSEHGWSNVSRIGTWTGSGYEVNGHLDELRISNTARYTASFTPSTTPFANDDNTLLLLHMDGTDGSTLFEDDNGVRASNQVIGYGATIDTAVYKFGGASAEFVTANNDYIVVPGNSSYDLSGDLTFEWWFKHSPNYGNQKMFDGRGLATAQGGTGILALADILMFDLASGYRVRCFVDGAERNTTQSLTLTDWHHFACVRESGTFKFFVDGTQYGSYVQSPVRDYSTMMTYNQPISSSVGTGSHWDGHIEEFRISNSARYTTGFTPPTEAFVNDDNTLLLLHMDGTDGSTDFLDDNGVRSKKGLFTVKDPQISTTQSKIGGASALFQGTHSVSGTSDVIRTGASSDFIFPGDFTWECWVYFIDNGTNDGMNFMSNRGGFNTTNLYMQGNHSNQTWQWGNSTMGANATTETWNYNTWYHVAIVRNGSGTNNFTLYVNGVALQSDTDTNTIGSAGYSDFIAIGAIYSASTPSFGLNGYIDEVRVSTVARYTANFTPATEPFQNDADTVLLLHMDGTDGSTTFVDDNGTH